MYIPLLRTNVPRQATACGLPHYQVEPGYNSDTESNQAAPAENDSIENYIRESETEMPSDSTNNSQVISSGSYDN
jgi:penicillin-binding protein 1B